MNVVDFFRELFDPTRSSNDDDADVNSNNNSNNRQVLETLGRRRQRQYCLRCQCRIRSNTTDTTTVTESSTTDTDRVTNNLNHHNDGNVSPPNDEQQDETDHTNDSTDYCTCRYPSLPPPATSTTCCGESASSSASTSSSSSGWSSTIRQNCPPSHPIQSFHRICRRIEQNDPTLTCVDLRDEFINVKKLAHALSINTTVRELNLQRTIRDRETRDARPRSAPAHDVLSICMDGLRYNTCLVNIDLSQTCIRASGALFVSRGLQNHPTIRKLRLSRCILTDAGVQTLGMAPLGTGLEELDLSHNMLSDGTPLLQILLMNTTIQSLDLSVNNLGPASLDKFLPHGFLSLRSLNLSRNQLCWDSPQSALARALGSSGRTNSNSVVDDSSELDPNLDVKVSRPLHETPELAPLQPEMHCRLEVLRLDSNMLSNAMAESIANGLRTNTSLRKLDLSQNFVGNKGAAALAMSISANPDCRLRDLCLGTNKIECRGALALLLYACSSSNCENKSSDESTNFQRSALDDSSSSSSCLTSVAHDVCESAIVHSHCPTSRHSVNGLTRLDLSNNKICDGQAISNALQFAGTYNDSPPSTKNGKTTHDSVSNDEKKKSLKTLSVSEDAQEGENLPDPRQPSSLRYFNIHRNPISLKFKHEIRFWTRLNASGGRRLLSIAGNSEFSGDTLAQWPYVLGDVSDDSNSIFFFLVRKPEICSFASSMATSP